MWLRDEIRTLRFFWNAAVVELWTARRRGDTPAGPNRHANRHAHSDLDPNSSAYPNTQTNPYGKGKLKPVHTHPAAHGHSFGHANSRPRGQSD